MIWHFEDRDVGLQPGEDCCIRLPLSCGRNFSSVERYPTPTPRK